MDTAEEGKKRRVGRRALLSEEHGRLLVRIAEEFPRSSLDELTREFNRRSGMGVCSATVRKGLRAAGVTRVRPQRAKSPRPAVQGSAAARVGYAAHHRRADGASGLNTDLTDAEWALLSDLFERQGGRGAPPRHPRRVIVNACLYVVRTGCAWRLLPKGVFPPWRAVYKAFRTWAHAGTFETMHDRLRQQWRDRVGRDPDPTAAIIDAQSTRSTAQGGNTGFDAGKKVKGRKRHLVVDTLGLLLAVTLTAAGVQDRDAAGAVMALACTKVPGLKTVYADSAYGGRCAEAIEKNHGVTVRVVRHPANRSTGTWQTAQQPLWPENAPRGFIVQAK